jgi:hypothetical protein
MIRAGVFGMLGKWVNRYSREFLVTDRSHEFNDPVHCFPELQIITRFLESGSALRPPDSRVKNPLLKIILLFTELGDLLLDLAAVPSG